MYKNQKWKAPLANDDMKPLVINTNNTTSVISVYKTDKNHKLRRERS